MNDLNEIPRMRICLIFLLVWSGVQGFTVPSPRMLPSTQLCSQDNNKKDFDIDQVTQEAEEALEVARKALDDESNDPPKVDVEAYRAVEQRTKAAAQFQSDAIAAALGGVTVGATLGGLVVVEIPDLALQVDPSVPPLVGAAVLGGAAFAGASQDSRLGAITRNLIGRPTKAVGRAVVGSATTIGTGITNFIAGIPGKVARAVKSKVEKTVDDIKAIPAKVQEAAINKAEQTAEEIRNIPVKVKDAAGKAASNLAEGVKATPGLVAKATQEAIDRSVDETQRKVELAVKEAKAYPAKKFNEFEQSFTSFVTGEPTDVPRPPRMPPPKIEEIPSPMPRQEPPKVLNMPKLKLSVPNIELPKVELRKPAEAKPEPPKKEVKTPSFDIPTPNFELPKVELNLPKIEAQPKTTPQPKKEKEENFIFSEVSLKNMMGKQEENKQDTRQAEKARREADAKKRRDAEERKRATDEEKKRQAQLQVAMRQKEAEEKKRAAEEARIQREKKQREAEAARQKAEQRRREQEARAKAAQQARIQREQEAERKRKEAELQRQIAAKKRDEESKKKADAAAKSAAQSIPKPSPTLSIFGSAAAKNIPQPSKRVAPQTPKSITKRAPRGVPTIVKWKQRRDGGITGRIYGSPNFEEGDRVETTAIVNGNVENGNVVQTGSGSRYFLSDTAPTVTDKSAIKTLLEAIPGATITLTKQRKEEDAKAAKKQLQESPAPRTFSLFGFGGSGEFTATEPGPKVETGSKNAPVKKAPVGVPTLSRWRKNGDGSITGFISGSKNFSEGEKVTTSPIVSGSVSSGEIVKTGSGSRYYLA